MKKIIDIKYIDENVIPLEPNQFGEAIHSYIREMVFNKYKKKHIEEKLTKLKDEINKDSILNETLKIDFIALIDQTYKNNYNQLLNEFNLKRAVKDVLEIIDS